MANKYVLKKYNINELHRRADSGDAFSMYVLGNKYLYGDEVDADIDVSIAWFRKAYKNESVDAERAIAVLSLYGIYLEKDCDLIISFLISAESKGDMKSSHLLGVLYMYGKCVDKDHMKSYFFMKKAYSKGHLLSGFFKILLIDNQTLFPVMSKFKYMIAMPIFLKWIYFNQLSKLCKKDRLWNLDMFHEVKYFDFLHKIKASYEEKYGPEML